MLQIRDKKLKKNKQMKQKAIATEIGQLGKTS